MVRMHAFQKKPASRDLNRIKRLAALFVLIIFAILLRFSHYQVFSREPWRSMAPDQYQRRVKLMAKRGIIFDRTGRILAMDIPVPTVAADPKEIKDIEKAGRKLEAIIGIDAQEFKALILSNPESRFVWVKKEITQSQQDSLLKYNIPGVIVAKDRKRVHPLADLGRPVLGVTNIDHTGVSGIELAMDKILHGRDGWAIYQKDAKERFFPSLDYPSEPALNGHHLTLSLDHSYQAILEEELKTGISKYRAKAGWGVLMDPFSGDVLAMASLTGFRHDNASDFNEQLRNRCVQEDFEPGSTFKIVTTAAALQEEECQPTSLIFCENGAYRVSAKHTIHDHDQSYAFLTLSQVLEVSSNIGMAKVGQKLGKERLFQYARDFGFGTRTYVGLPHEEPGILRPAYSWSDFSTAVTSFGQGLSGTALQIASMVSAIANGGELLKPVLIKEILSESGVTEKTFGREVLRRVVSQKTASTLTAMLERVVEEGSGEKAAVPGVRVAGKTGTAQKSGPDVRGYQPGVYVSSFVGFWPADTPMYVLVVVLDEPAKAHYGSQSAAPIFSKIASRIIGLPNPLPEERPRPRAGNFAFSSLQDTAPGVETGSIPSAPIESPYHMPDLRGLSVREAMQKCVKYNIEAQVLGSGIVTRQQPAPGKKIEPAIVCRLTCRER